MPFDASKVLRVEITFTLALLPLVIWLAFYTAYRWWSFNSRPLLPWLKTLRWISWVFGLFLLFLSLGLAHFSWVYGTAMTTFSIGLTIPEGWVKRRFAPELIELNSPDGYWPTERE